MSTLSGERCVACRRDSPRVTEAEIVELRREVPDWRLVERDRIARLERAFHLPSFADALAFTNRVGALAENEGHHPALLTEWGASHSDLVDPQDPRAPPERVHHGGQDRRAGCREWTRLARRDPGESVGDLSLPSGAKPT
jgi:4a-hydroxytetrahydrobiopterin dehydratase